MTPTDEEKAELRLLALKNELNKFGIEVRDPLPKEEQEALERLQLKDWIRLIDVTPLATSPGIFRIFLVMPEAREWYSKYKQYVLS